MQLFEIFKSKVRMFPLKFDGISGNSFIHAHGNDDDDQPNDQVSCFAWCQSHSTQYYRVLQTITSVLCDRMKINSTYSQCSHGSVSNDMLQCFRWLLAASPGPEPGGAIIEYVLFCQDPSSSILSAMFYETPCIIIIILLCCD